MFKENFFVRFYGKKGLTYSGNMKLTEKGGKMRI